MKKFYAIILIATVVIFAFYQRQAMQGSVDAKDLPEDVQPLAILPEAPPEKTESIPVKVSGENLKAGEKIKEDLTPEIQILQNHLDEISRCLGIHALPASSGAEMNFFHLSTSVQEGFGEIVSDNESWSSIDLRTSSGERRRIILEAGGGESGHEVDVEYFRVKEDGSLEAIPLSEVQSRLSQESLLAQLEADGKVVNRSKSRQIYFKNAYMSLTEQDGKIKSYEATFKNKTLRCEDLAHDCVCEINP